MTDRLRGLIFDIDGTLADTEEVHRVAFNQAFDEFALGVHWDKAEHRRRLPGGSGRERLVQLFAEPELAARHPKPDDLIVSIHERKTEIFTGLVEQGRAELRPGVLRLIREARGLGLRLGVASTAHTRSVHTVLRTKLGDDLYRAFGAVYGGNDVTAKKPHPEVYLRCAADLGLAPGEAIALEDTFIGLSASRAAGIPTVLTYNDWSDGQDFSGALAVLDSLGDPGAPCRVRRGPPGWSPEHVTVDDLRSLVTGT